jgi:hypothetical protein
LFDEFTEFFAIYVILSAALWPKSLFSLQQKGVPEILLGVKELPLRKADNLTVCYGDSFTLLYFVPFVLLAMFAELRLLI